MLHAGAAAGKAAGAQLPALNPTLSSLPCTAQIGGSRAPTPVGDLGFVEMTQALPLAEHSWRTVGPDLLLTGYLPASGGLRELASSVASGGPRASDDLGRSGSGGTGQQGRSVAAAAAASGPREAGLEAAAAASSSSSSDAAGASVAAGAGAVARRHSWQLVGAVEFYKAWDRYGSLGNFSPHAIDMPEGPMTASRAAALATLAPGAGVGEPLRRWPSVEHYYQVRQPGKCCLCRHSCLLWASSAVSLPAAACSALSTRSLLPRPARPRRPRSLSAAATRTPRRWWMPSPPQPAPRKRLDWAAQRSASAPSCSAPTGRSSRWR